MPFCFRLYISEVVVYVREWETIGGQSSRMQKLVSSRGQLLFIGWMTWANSFIWMDDSASSVYFGRMTATNSRIYMDNLGKLSDLHPLHNCHSTLAILLDAHYPPARH